MASILRSGKLMRYFANFTRNVVINSVRETDGNLLQSVPCMCSQLQHGLASSAAPKSDVNLEKQLKRLDQDVRRIGRISRRDIEDVMEEIRHQRSATSSQSLLVIRCCGNLVPEELPEVRTALVQEIWKTLNTLNVPMDISHYNALLRVYLENEHSFSPTDFLTEIESKSIEPNRVTYQRLIARYCHLGDIEGATRILEFMREKNLPVNENVFNSLILGHSQANDMESAKGILSVMKQAGLEPSADTYTTLLCCYARHGEIDAIISTIHDCEMNEIYLLDKDLMDAVYHLAINGHSNKVDVVLGKLRLSTGFNQDAVNTILRLVNKGYEEVGLKILRLMPRATRTDGQMVDAGSFFIRQLVKANRPIEKILEICRILQNEGLNPKALLIATEAGLTNGLVHNALPLLKEMKNAGLPIRQHYFWPLICAVESNQIIGIVQRMQNEFSVNPNAETIRDYVIPNLKEKNWGKIVNLLRDAGVSNFTAASSTAYAALSANQITDAADIMESHRAFYSPQIFRQPLLQALSKTNDYSAFIRIVRQIHDNAERIGQKPDHHSERETDANESFEANSNLQSLVVGQILNDACAYFRNERLSVMEKLLTALVEQGLSISSNQATRLSERIGSEMTPQISELLEKLSSGELEPVPLKNNLGSNKRSIESMTLEEIERFIAKVEERNENSNNLKRHLLNACFRSKNLQKTIQVIENLESNKFTIPTGVWAQLIDLYVHHEKLSEALELYEKHKSKNPEFVIDNIKTIHVVELFLKEDRLDDAIKFLERNKKFQPFVDGEGSFNYVTTVWRVLNFLADTGDAQKLQNIFDALIQNNYILPTNVLLGPLIKVHLVKDDLQKAMEVFENICEKYKSTPWKNELACRLIQKEDATNLQKLTDLSTNIHGEVNSLYDLVFSFVECGRIRQARKILETPGLRTRPHRIDNACERYKNEGMVQPLEGLIEATKDLNHIDRNGIFYNLLLSYAKTDDTEKAVGLWTKMQEENIAPTDVFLNKLAELLKKNKIEVPFVVPELAQGKNTKSKLESISNVADDILKSSESKLKDIKSIPENVQTPQTPKNLSLFRKAVQNGKVDTAISLKSQFQPGQHPSIGDMSHLIEHLVRAGRLSEATNCVYELLEQKHTPVQKIFKYYLNKIAASGDIGTLQHIGENITSEQKQIFSFDNRFCHANIVAGKADEYVKQMLNEISNAKSEEEAAKLVGKFPRGGALGILENHSELVPQFKDIAEKYAKFNQLGPMNVLWMHLISIGNLESAKNIWDTHLSTAPRLMFQRVLQTAREKKDEKLAVILIDQLRSSKISDGAIGNAYSCLIDIQISNENYDQALETVHAAVKDICLENLNRTALNRLKLGLEQKNKTFPYVVPEKTNKNAVSSSSSSSSSSDDDVSPKRPETRPSKPSNVE